MCVSGIKKFYLYGKFCTRTKSTRPHSSWSMKHSICQKYFTKLSRGTSRTPVSSKMEFFVTLVNGWKSLIKLKESSILDVKGVLDTPLVIRKSRRNLQKNGLIKNFETCSEDSFSRFRWHPQNGKHSNSLSAYLQFLLIDWCRFWSRQ